MRNCRLYNVKIMISSVISLSIEISLYVSKTSLTVIFNPQNYAHVCFVLPLQLLLSLVL